MKATRTVNDHLNYGSRNRCMDVVLAAALEFSDSVSQEVIAAARALSECSLDAEHEFDAAVTALYLAEQRFLEVHGETEVSL